MPRRPKVDLPSYFHVFNRAAYRQQLFDNLPDYLAFLEAIEQGQRRRPVPLLSYSVMPNHFHLVVGPTLTPPLSAFMHQLEGTHAKRWREHRGTRGGGHVYQGPFQAVTIGDAGHFLTVCRYVERNPLEAGLVQRAEQWPWSSLARADSPPTLSPWPVAKPVTWIDLVNEDTSVQDVWG